MVRAYQNTSKHQRWLELKQSRLLDYFFYTEFNNYEIYFIKIKN